MQDILGAGLRKLKLARVRKKRMGAAVLALSLIVSLDVFWLLRQPGLTLAGDASCEIAEHTHDESCSISVCICDIPEEPHTHDADCYESRWVEEQEQRQTVCTQTLDPHIHGDACYETALTPITEIVLRCEDPDEAHIHGETCYETVETGSTEEAVLICDLLSEPHQHTDGCFAVTVIPAHEERTLICRIPEGGHTHGDACYEQQTTCGFQAHVHQLECYSDPTADAETMLDWQEMFEAYPYTGDLAEDLAGIAKTQVGYSESTRNFEVGADGVRRGYTRYGAWYGMPYSDWSAMFVSFCLHYAGADPDTAPGNTGAAAMAEAWKRLGNYADRGDYTPSAGDLVFFADSTVGIVTEVYSATCYVIRGDVDGAVRGGILSLADASVTGWGLTRGPAPPGDDPAAPDVSGGPVFLIYAGEQTQPPARRFALKAVRNAIESVAEDDAAAVTDLITYLNAHNGSYFYTLVDTNNHELPKDDDGNYIVTAGVSYKLTLTVNNPDGFLPGVYQYQIPNGLLVNGGIGSFVLKDGTNVGDWEVTDGGLITLDFNEHMNSRTDITISATMGIMFPEQEEPLDFDGKISVTIEPPLQTEAHTKLNKWGKQGAEDGEQNKTDPSKLYWTIEIVGQKDSSIPGSVITDQIKTGAHHYTPSDMARGIEFGVSEYDPVSGQTEWHSWTVYPGDPALTWTETGWTYTIPETITCWCGEVTLGNENWIYYVNYSSTPDPFDTPGKFWFTNSATVDGQYAQGWGEFNNGEAAVGIVKRGAFHGDADGGIFLWEFQATVPGRAEGAKAAYYTQIMDHLRVKAKDNATVAYVQNDADRATVTALYNGQTIPVPHAQDATGEDPFAWIVGWSSESNGVYYTRALLPLCRCNCTEQSCHYWDVGNNRCGALHYLYGEWGAYPSGFCYCWTHEQDLTLTFTYETNDPAVIEAYGGMDMDLQNEVVLQHTVYQPDGSESTVTIGDAIAKVPIPGVFKKELTSDFDGYTANYNITVNEAKLVLTNGSPLTIHDEMTATLAYISGSLVITTEDANGNTATLQQGTDYTVTYDGTGKRTDEDGKVVHVLDIVILHPQPVMYTLDYDATLIIPDQVTEGIRYGNSATITLWGEEIRDDSAEKVYADINIAAKNFRVELYKTDSETDEPLGHATFGLFNAQGGLISTATTNNQGYLFFETDIVRGIILREHELYYLQELAAPPGYRLDDTRHWFCFCSSTEAFCATCDAVLAGLQAVRIPFEQIGKVRITNELAKYDLPATGGIGIYPVLLASVICILTPLVYGSIRRRKQERRGVG